MNSHSTTLNGSTAHTSPSRARPAELHAPPTQEATSSHVAHTATDLTGAKRGSLLANGDGPDLDSLPSRASRPGSLFIPMDESPRTSVSGPSNTPSWPFRGGGLTLDDRRGSHNTYPASPSLINPSYADLPNPPRHFTDYELIATPDQRVMPEKKPLYPSAPAGSSAVDMGRSVSPNPNPRRGLTGGSKGAGFSRSASGGYDNSSSLMGRLAKNMDTPTAWLILYFAFNLGLTLYNKLVLQGFPFPWTLTAIQMLSGTIGTQIALNRGFFVQARLTTREGLTMVAFSVLYTVNIAVSNLSLHLVTVPFHQVVRAMTPLFTLIISAIAFRKTHSRDTYLSLLPVILGVVFATYGDYSFTAWGFILTLLGTLLAALKTIVTNRVQVGRLKLHPLDLLIRMSPLAFCQCVFFGWTSGELDRVRIYGATEMTSHKAWALAFNGAIAFGLNVVSFTANKKTSALTMTVAANVKQVLTIVLAVLIFNVALNPTNLFGITLTLAGGAWYAKVELQEKQARALASSTTLPGRLA